MIRLDDVLILTPQITPTEARMVVVASWKALESVPPPIPPLRLEGQVVGPLCEYAATLSSRFPFRSGSFEQSLNLKAAVQILEPCFWEPEHPFCYEVQLELHGLERLLDMRRVTTGIRHLAAEGTELLLNGQVHFLQGVWHSSASSITELEGWHEVECGAFLTTASPDLCGRTDRWGPMVLHVLPPITEEASEQVVRMRNHPSLLMWVVPAEITGEYLKGFIQTVRLRDPSRPIGQLVSIDQLASAASHADVLILPAGHPEIGNQAATKPYIVVGRFAGYTNDCTPGNFTERMDELRQSLGQQPGLVGVIV